MIDQTQLTETERIQLKKLLLEKKKESLEKELQELQDKTKGYNKNTLNQMTNYFKN